ncbi:hypothetical protein QYF36_001940 [Acer negundo]|nr:hypothetical protein QYF36_001940 [Acer negundo]
MKCSIVCRETTKLQLLKINDFLFIEHQYDRTRSKAAFKIATQHVIEVDKPNIKEEKEYGTNPPSKWSTRTLSSGMRKKHTHELAAEMEYEDAAEKKENVEEEEDDPEEA